MNWTKRQEPQDGWEDREKQSFLLTEALGFLLQENGGKITLEESYQVDTTWDNREKQSFLLTEALGFLLQENGGKITLEESYQVDTTWDNRNKAFY